MATSKRIHFGPVSNVKEGDSFVSHAEMYAKGVHRGKGQGISGGAREGVDSIVMSGGYADDRDYGDVIIYTGRGGSPDKQKLITEDQSLELPQNSGLVRNVRDGLLVRVVRGKVIPKSGNKKVYTYGGLYRVDDYWSKRTERGHLLWQFRLVKVNLAEEVSLGGDVVSGDDGEDDVTSDESENVEYVGTQRRIRNTAVTQAIKDLYQRICQMCEVPLVVGKDGATYTEGAHIDALGKPHLGRDAPENVLSLCPNCHVLFDNGARLISDDFKVIDGLTGEVIRDLYVKWKKHKINVKYVQRHRARWADRLLAP